MGVYKLRTGPGEFFFGRGFDLENFSDSPLTFEPSCAHAHGNRRGMFPGLSFCFVSLSEARTKTPSLVSKSSSVLSLGMTKSVCFLATQGE